jgi:GTP-binding protein HflX
MAQPKERSQIKVEREKAVLAAVHLPDSRFDERDPLGELRALAETAGATVVGEMTQNRARPEAGTYIGSGKVEELKAMCDELGAAVIIFDHELSPKQIANIEKITERKVLDRSELILDIFAARATTRQAQIAVELAQLEYTFPRLVAMWSHLERIVGVGGIAGVGTRGPGEKQIEIDRRLVMARKTRLRRELEEINARKRREVFARNVENVTIGLVGYTNAGKSTLFNTLTAGGAFAADKLFATLMTRTREWNLGGGNRVLLSDTVGFIRDLPHHLIASFRATLEEATHADCLIVVVDAADPAAQMQYETVMGTLRDLFQEAQEYAKSDGLPWTEPELAVVLNKVDRLRDKSTLLAWAREVPGCIPIAAVDPTHEGVTELTGRIRSISRGPVREVVLTIPMSESKAIDTIEKQARVLERVYDGGVVRLRTEIGSRQIDRLVAGGARIVVGEVEPSAI